MAHIIKTDGTIQPVTPKNGKKFTLEEMQAAVGGYIETVPHSNSRAYANEEGLVHGLPFNPVASRRFDYPLVGDVFVLDKGDRA